MRRTAFFSLVLVLGAALAGSPAARAQTATPTPSPQAPEVVYAGSGEARGVEIAVGEQGVTLGAALAEADSTPSASGIGAGQCEIIGEGSPEDAACNDATGERSSAPGEEGDDQETCAAPSLPAPLNDVIQLELACGFSQSEIVDGVPTTTNSARTLDAQISFGLAGLRSELADAKGEIVADLQSVTGARTQDISDAFDEILGELVQAEAGRIDVGAVSSHILGAQNEPQTLTVETQASATKIGLLGIPRPVADGAAGSANPLEEGLIIIEIGKASSTASLNLDDLTTEADALAASVVVKVRDITQPGDPVYEEIEVAPGQTVVLFEGTPLESTITGAGVETKVAGSNAQAASDAILLHLLQGDEFQGGLRLGLGRTTAAVGAEVQKVSPTPPPEPLSKTLPRTGTDSAVPIALVLLLLAAIALIVRSRLARR